MTAQRPHTGRGVPADRPDGVYEPPELVQLTATGLEVTVIGEGRRRRTFAFKTFPLPGWHQPLPKPSPAAPEPAERCGRLRAQRQCSGAAGASLWNWKRWRIRRRRPRS